MTTADVTTRVLELATRSIPGADIEVRVDRLQSALTRFANSFIHQNVDEDGTTISLRLHAAGRTVALSSTSGDATTLVDRARTMLAAAPKDSGWPGLTPPHRSSAQSTVDEQARDCPPARRAALVHDFVSAAGGLDTAGYCRTCYWTGSYRNSAGHEIDGAATAAVFDGIARHAGADGVARRESARLSELDAVALGAAAAESARSQAAPIELPPGRYEVVLLPGAAADILNILCMHGFNGKIFVQGRSFVALGEQQFDPAITITDNPFDRVGGTSFDTEGTAKTRLTLVDKGVTAAVTHDRRTAAKAGAASTGHALAVSDSYGPQALNPGFAPGDTSVDDMLSGMDRGILVADFWYTRVLDPRTLVVTGLTRNGAWLVEGGQVVSPVRNFRFTEAYPKALGPGNVLAVGSDVTPLPNRNELMNSCAVALRLASWNFTGGASG